MGETIFIQSTFYRYFAKKRYMHLSHMLRQKVNSQWTDFDRRRRDPENKRQNHFLSPNTDLFEPASCKKATKKSPKLREKSQTAVLPDTQKFIKD